jgi:homopolymeric O-antigen transport system permease protein
MTGFLNLIRYFLVKDIKARYAGSGLGVLWSILLPIFQIFLFWFVFSGIMKSRPYANTQMPYIFFLLSSFFFWLAFSEGVFRASQAITENAEMVKKVSFPTVILPITVTISSYIHNMVGFILFIVFFVFVCGLSPTLLSAVPVICLQLMFSLGLGMFLAALMPYFRDMAQILGPVMQGLFFLSPIIYSLESLPDRYKTLFYLNPMTYFATCYHRAILLNTLPRFTDFGIIFSFSLGTFFLGYYAFRKLKEGFADVL